MEIFDYDKVLLLPRKCRVESRSECDPSIELEAAGSEAWHAWLLLVEKMPAGADGSPVPRVVVRKVFRPDWQGTDRGPGALAETRSMQMPARSRPERLRLVAVLQDGRGRMRAITQTECRE